MSPAKRRYDPRQWIVAVADGCSGQPGDQPRSGDLIHARSYTKDGPLAEPGGKKNRPNYNHLFLIALVVIAAVVQRF